MNPTTGASTAVVVGGAAAGKALHLARLGVRTSLVLLPDDADVPDRAAIEGAGVTVVDRAASDVTPQELTQLVGGAGVVLVALTRSVHPFLSALSGAGAGIWVDLADWDGSPSELHDPFVEAGSCLFLSDAELDDPLRTAERLLPGKELVVITHGKRGATAFFPDTEPFFVLPHDEGPMASTDGARDGFCSGAAHGYTQGWDWPRALRAGAVVAGGCVAVAGSADLDLTADWLEARL